LEEKELERYWIDKFTDFYENNETLVPLWVKRQYWKYEADSSSTDEENIDPKTYTEIPSADGRKQVSENDDDESLNGDPTTRRCDSDFYQNIEDRCLSR